MNDLSIGKEREPDSEMAALSGTESALQEQETCWIAAAQADPAAFEPLYVRYRERVYRYVRTRLSSDEDAADLTQQIFLQAMAALPRYRPRGVPFAVWLFRIARHAAINFATRESARVSWDELPEVSHPFAGAEQSPEVLVMHRETLGHLHELLAALEPEKRELLALRFAGGLNATQIATLVGRQPEAVKKQINRLLQSFKEHFHHEHER